MTTSVQPARRRWINNPRDLFVFIGVFLAISFVVSIAAVLIWVSNPAQPGAVALTALVSDDAVQITQDGGTITFDPINRVRSTVGYIFYPGALVDARAYAPILRPIAEAGFLTITTAMPLNLAILDIQAADRLRAAHPEIEQWVIGGHSMGGSMTSRYVLDARDLAGLVLVASFPYGDLSGLTLETLSIYGTQDGLVSLSEIEESRPELPEDAIFIPIDGGNHAGFGDYGAQARDLVAQIAPGTQHMLTAAVTLEMLGRVARESGG